MKEAKEMLLPYSKAYATSADDAINSLHSIICLQNEEREYIVTQLRDNIAQVLTSCKLLLETVQDREDKSTFIERINKYLLQAVSDVTSLSYRVEGNGKDACLMTAV
jgi:signal transduction histidine kinase